MPDSRVPADPAPGPDGAGPTPPTPAAAPGERSHLGRPARFATGWTTVGDGVHAWLQPNGELGESNAGLVAGDDASLQVDTCWDERLTRAMLDARPDAPPTRTLVNTHGDGDHVWGNALLPDAEVVATEAAAAQIAEEHPRGLAAFRRLALTTRHAPPGPGRLGTPRTLGRYATPLLGPYAFGDARRRAPDRTFSGRLDLRVGSGGREVRLIEAGPAHTPGDLVVHVPDAAVVFAADLVFVGVTPIAWCGPISRWRRALDRIGGLGARVVVPGHGPLAGAPELAELDAYWSWLASAARRERDRAGARAPAIEVARRILRSDRFRSSPWGTWDAPERVLVNVVALEHEAARTEMHVGPAGRLGLFAGMARLAAERDAG